MKNISLKIKLLIFSYWLAQKIGIQYYFLQTHKKFLKTSIRLTAWCLRLRSTYVQVMYKLFTDCNKVELAAPPEELQSDKAAKTKC